MYFIQATRSNSGNNTQQAQTESVIPKLIVMTEGVMWSGLQVAGLKSSKYVLERHDTVRIHDEATNTFKYALQPPDGC